MPLSTFKGNIINTQKCGVLLCDGYTSSSILWSYIKKIYPNSDLHFLTQSGKQHGINAKINEILGTDYDLIIAPDSSTSDKNEMLALIAEGKEILCIDHHEATLDKDGSPKVLLGNPHAVIINNQLSEKYPNKTLCGAGMVYKFCEALDDYYGEQFAREFIDLAALGEISDVMFQGTSETRYIITQGLKSITNGCFKAFLAAQDFSLKGRGMPPYAGLTPINIAFYISPLINAVTRMGTDEENRLMFIGFTDPFREIQSTKRGASIGETEKACEAIARIAGNIKKRQGEAIAKAVELLDERIHEQNLLKNSVIYIEVYPEDNIPTTLTGLLCQRFVSKYGRPCLIGRKGPDDIVRGSMRSSSNFEELPSFKEYLEDSGFFDLVAGHNQAAGQIISESNIKPFLEYSNEKLSSSSFENCYSVDYELSVNNSAAKEIGMIFGHHENCFGNGIDEVTCIIKNVPLRDMRVMGKENDCVKISANGIDFVRFKDREFIDLVQRNKDKVINVYTKFSINEYRGKISLQCIIEDWEFSQDIDERYDF